MSEQPTPRPDWEAIEREYRADQLSIREIARQYGVSDTAIRKKAAKENWTRELAEKVRRGVNEALVRDEGSQSGSQEGSQSQRARSDDEITKAAVARGVEVVREHRKSLARAHKIVDALLEDLGEVAGAKARRELEETILAETAPPLEGETKTAARERHRARQKLLDAVALPQQAQAAATLSLTLKNLIPLERKAFNLDEPEKGDEAETPLDKLRKQISGTAIRPTED